MNYKTTNKKFVYVLFSLLTIPVILNGYPILFNDSAAYISTYTSIISLFWPPVNRPISYGIFIFLTSIGRSSLFYVSLFQDFLMAYLISKVLRIKKLNINLIFLLIYLPMSYIAILSNTIMPDIWLSMGYLSVYILIFTDNIKKPVFYFVIFCSVAFAPANGLIILFSTLFLWLSLRLNKSRELSLVMLTIISSLFLLSYDDYISYDFFSPIAGSNTFWVGRLIGDGLAQDQVNKLCSEKNYINTSPCINKKQYMNRSDENFMWGNYKNNFNPWNMKYKKFFSAVKDQTLIHSPISFSYIVLKNGLETLTKLPNNLYQLYGRYNKKTEYNWPYRAIRMYFNYHNMMHAWQQTSANAFNYLPITNIGILVALIITLIANLGYIKDNIRAFTSLSAYTFSCIVINAFINGGLSMVNSRFNVEGFGVIIILYCFILASRGFSTTIRKT